MATLAPVTARLAWPKAFNHQRWGKTDGQIAGNRGRKSDPVRLWLVAGKHGQARQVHRNLRAATVSPPPPTRRAGKLLKARGRRPALTAARASSLAPRTKPGTHLFLHNAYQLSASKERGYDSGDSIDAASGGWVWDAWNAQGSEPPKAEPCRQRDPMDRSGVMTNGLAHRQVQRTI